MITVRPGQIWQSTDPREQPPLKVLVLEVDPQYATVESVHGGRRRRILIVPNRSAGGRVVRGYRLVSDADLSALSNKKPADVAPTQILAEAIRAADGGHGRFRIVTMTADGVAQVVAAALSDERIIATAVEALVERGWTAPVDERLTRDNLSDIVRIAFRAVGGA